MADLAARGGICRGGIRPTRPNSSSSTPAIFAKGRPRKSSPNSESCASSRTTRRKAGRRTTLVVAGCVAQAEGAEILRRQPAVDVVVGPQSYHRLPELLRQAEVRSGRDRHRLSRSRTSFRACRPAGPKRQAKRGVAAFVTVQEGCDKFCSFCVVPYTRGAEASRPVDAVLEEVRRLTDAGRPRGHADRTERQRLSRP